VSDKSQPSDPSQADPHQLDPTAEQHDGAGPDDTIPQAAASGSRWEDPGEEARADAAEAPQAAPQPVPITAHPTGDPIPGESRARTAAAAGSASWAGRPRLRGDGAGPSPWARRIGLAGAAAALVAVGGVGGYAVGNASSDGDRFTPTSFQVDRDGDGGFRGDHHGFGEDDRGEGLPGQGEGFGAPGDDGPTDQSDGTGTTT
jgi:hypothetical protein